MNYHLLFPDPLLFSNIYVACYLGQPAVSPPNHKKQKTREIRMPLSSFLICFLLCSVISQGDRDPLQSRSLDVSVLMKTEIAKLSPFKSRSFQMLQ